MRAALVLVCALVFGVRGVRAYEVVLEKGAFVFPRGAWTAVATTPVLGEQLIGSTSSIDTSDGVTQNAPPTPGEVRLAPFGALHVTRTTSLKSGSESSSPHETFVQTRVAVVLLGAFSTENHRASGTQQPTHVAIEVFAGTGGYANANSSESESETIRVATCELRLDETTRLFLAADSGNAACTASAAAVENDLITAENAGDVPSPPVDNANDVTMTRIELALPASSKYPLEYAVVTRVTMRLLRSDDDDENQQPVALVVSGVALVSRNDLVTLAWSWLERATRCASSVRNDLFAKCGGDDASITSMDLWQNINVDTLVNGCCDAISAYADASCSCALRIVNGSSAFSTSSAVSLTRQYDTTTMDAAVASLGTICFGKERNDDERGTSSCVSASATLAATRAVVLERVGDGVLSDETVSAGSVYDQGLDWDQGNESGGNQVAAQAGQPVSPSDEYAAFLDWLDGETDSNSFEDEKNEVSDANDTRNTGAASVSRSDAEMNVSERIQGSSSERDGTLAKQAIFGGFFYQVFYGVCAFAAVSFLGFVSVALRNRKNRQQLLGSTGALLDSDGDVYRLVARRRAGDGG